MADNEITAEEIADLCAKLALLELSVSQRNLLNAILKIAWDASREHTSSDDPWDGCFEPGQVASILAYPGARSASFVTNALGPGFVTKAWHGPVP